MKTVLKSDTQVSTHNASWLYFPYFPDRQNDSENIQKIFRKYSEDIQKIFWHLKYSENIQKIFRNYSVEDFSYGQEA